MTARIAAETPGGSRLRTELAFDAEHGSAPRQVGADACLRPQCVVSDFDAMAQTSMHGTAAAPGTRIVTHDKERWHGDTWFASSPSARGAVGRGHRRGLDGRVDAKTPYKSPTPSPANVVRIPATAGTVTRGTLRSEVSGGGARRATGDMSGEESPESPCPTPRAPRNKNHTPPAPPGSRNLGP